MQLLLTWFVTALVFIFSAYILIGVQVENFFVAIVSAFVLGLLNAFLKPIFVLLTLPINILTLGLFTLVINGVLVMLVDAIVPGFNVDNFGWALLLSIIISLTSALIGNQKIWK